MTSMTTGELARYFTAKHRAKMMNAYQNPVRNADEEIIAQLYGWDVKTVTGELERFTQQCGWPSATTGRTDPMGYFGPGVATTGIDYWREYPTLTQAAVLQEWTAWPNLDDPHQRFAEAAHLGNQTAKEGKRRAFKAVLFHCPFKQPEMWPSINTPDVDFSPQQFGALDPF